MARSTSARTDRGIERGQAVVETLVKEPVKAAVREAMAEAETERGAKGTDETEASETSSRSGRRLRPALVMSMLGLAATALYLRRRHAGPSESHPQAGPSSGTTPRTESAATASEPGPAGGSELRSDETSGSEGDDTEQDRDEEATTSS